MQGVTSFEVSVHVFVDGVDVRNLGGTMCGANNNCSFTVNTLSFCQFKLLGKLE